MGNAWAAAWEHVRQDRGRAQAFRAVSSFQLQLMHCDDLHSDGPVQLSVQAMHTLLLKHVA